MASNLEPAKCPVASSSNPTPGPVAVPGDDATPSLPIPTMISRIDETVLGYAKDKPVRDTGVTEMASITQLLEKAGVPCCMVAEAALIYYGTGRIKTQWVVCVPQDKFEQAHQLMLCQNGILEPFQASSLVSVDGLEHFFPRFKFVGIRLFFVLISSQAVHITCTPDNIEYSHSGIPYPKLPVYAQSLLETLNLVDLDDLVDGMDLTTEWGERNLKLDGQADATWGRWRADFLNNGKKAEDCDIPQWCFDPPALLKVWQESTSQDAKKDRQGWKYSPHMATRFRRHGKKDPRLHPRSYC